MKILQTAERVSAKDMSDNYVFQRSLLAYVKAAELVSGNVLEIGTGSGYGIEIIAPECEHFTTIDKFETEIVKSEIAKRKNVSFKQMTVPSLQPLADESFDFVITFQVIEHIQNDKLYVSEMARVLKKGGKLIVTTPNKKMSLTRNPWHIREYTIQELDALLKKDFSEVENLGVFGNKAIMDYYNVNKEKVKKITRFDIFNLQHNLPRWMLQIPYDILNRLNRKKILKENENMVSLIKMEDYHIAEAQDECFDLFYIAKK